MSQWISYFLNIILAIWTFYLYAENRRFKTLEYTKELKRLKLEKAGLLDNQRREIELLDADYANRGLSNAGAHIGAKASLRDRHAREIEKVDAEIEYYTKMLDNSWLKFWVKK